MREFFAREVDKGSLLSWSQLRKQAVAGAKVFLLLGVPLIVCLLVSASKKGPRESEIERGLWRLTQQVSSLPVPYPSAASESIQTVGPFRQGKCEAGAPTPDSDDKKLQKSDVNGLTSMALDLVHMIIRVPTKEEPPADLRVARIHDNNGRACVSQSNKSIAGYSLSVVTVVAP